MKKTEPKPQPWKRTVRQQYELEVPPHFYVLCELFEVTVEQMLHNFMNTMGRENHSMGEGPEDALLQYILQCGYGQEFYTPDEIKQMLAELRAMRLLWPSGGTPAMIHKHAEWRNLYNNHWRKKWYRKVRRKDARTDQDLED